jgi:hypothetical protein
MRGALVVLRAAWSNVAEGKHRKDCRLKVGDEKGGARHTLQRANRNREEEEELGPLAILIITHLKRPTGDGKASPLKNLAKKVGPRNILEHTT